MVGRVVSGLGGSGRGGHVLTVPNLLEANEERGLGREQADEVPLLQLVFSLGARFVGDRIAVEGILGSQALSKAKARLSGGL